MEAEAGEARNIKALLRGDAVIEEQEALSAAEGAALSRDQDRIPHSSESRVICIVFQILAQSQKNY